jgi:hypothetical protein
VAAATMPAAATARLASVNVKIDIAGLLSVLRVDVVTQDPGSFEARWKTPLRAA